MNYTYAVDFGGGKSVSTVTITGFGTTTIELPEDYTDMNDTHA